MTLKPEFFLQKTIGECRSEAVEHLKAAEEEPEHSGCESIEKGDKND